MCAYVWQLTILEIAYTPVQFMKLLAFAASNSQRSINRALVKYSLGRIKNISPELEIELLDLNDFEMPIYSIDRENDTGIPEKAQDFLKHIGEADFVLVSFAEHNGFVTAAWKNIFDWMSRIDAKVWQQKPIAMLAATPGGRAGQNVLASQAMLAPHFGGELIGQLGIGGWNNAWDPDKETLLADTEIKALDELLTNLLQEN